MSLCRVITVNEAPGSCSDRALQCRVFDNFPDVFVAACGNNVTLTSAIIWILKQTTCVPLNVQFLVRRPNK